MKTISTKKALLAHSIFALVLFFNTAFSLMAQNPKWSLPTKLYNPPFLTPLPQYPQPGLTQFYDYSGEVASHSHNSMPDANGNLLFFIVDERVYDKDGYFIDEMNAEGWGGSMPMIGTPELCIVPDPGNCNRYYIFSGAIDFVMALDPSYAVHRPLYAILDMSQPNTNQLPGRFGAFEYDITLPYTYNAFLLTDLLPGSGPYNLFNTWFNYAASKLRTDNSRFVFAYNGWGEIYRFKITGTGISFHGNASTTAPTPGPLTQIQHSEMELFEPSGPGNYKIACAGNMQVALTNVTHAIYTAELDYATGNLVPGSEHYFYFTNDPQAKIHGLEFSANGNYLYITHETNVPFHPRPIEYIDLTIPTPIVTPIPTSIIPAGEALNFKYSFIEMGLDGNMYFVNDNRFAMLSGTDNPATAVWTNTVTPISPFYNFQSQVMESNSGASYTLPDQIDGMDYVNFFTSTDECCISSNVYDQVIYTAGQAAPWTANVQTWTPTSNPLNNSSGNPNAYIQEKLIIPAGHTVTIIGMNIHFAPIVQGSPGDPGAILEVLRSNSSAAGGRLILKGCTLTVDDRCNPGAVMWMGAQVQGDPSLSQTLPTYATSKQGKIELMNNGSIPSVVEHAQKGIIASKATMNPSTLVFSFDFGYDGGVIRATDATFRNNVYDIEMRKYIVGSVNQSFFTNCNFETQTALNIPTLYPVYHVFLNDLLNITFKGCDFKNSFATDASLTSTLGTGLRTIDAKITVQNNCTSMLFPCSLPNTDYTNFQNLYWGILSTNSNPLRTVTCLDANFINNRRSILLSGVNYAQILRNKFNLYKSAAPNSAAQVYGLYMNSCTGYKVEENNFQDINHATIMVIGNSYGIIVNNSGPYDNEIYKNTFHNLYIGGQSQGTNACFNPMATFPNQCFPGPGQIGLRWKCNTFNDVIIFGDLVVTSGRIAYDQGYCISSSLPPAGNLFNHTGSPPLWNIFANSSVQQFRYTYHYGALPNYFDPINYTLPPVNKDLCEGTTCATFGATCCPSKIGTRSVQTLIAEVKVLRQQIAEQKLLIDGGNTSNLLAYVNSNASNGNKKNMLMSKSPYLSDEVLIAYLNHNPPPGHIQQVLLANSGISDPVWNVVQTMGLHNGIKNSINAVRSTFSQRSQLYQKIGGLTATKNINLYEVVGYYLRDTISINPLDSILKALDEEDEKVFLSTKVDANIEKGDLIEATSLKGQIISAFGENNSTKMMGINIDLTPSPSKCYGIMNNPTLYNHTVEIAYDVNDMHCQAYAQALLSLALSSSFDEIIEGVMIEHSMPINNPISNDESPSVIKLYPNPALGELFIEAITNTNGDAWSFVNVSVTDMQGRVLITKYNDEGWTFLNLDLNNIQSGNYIIRLTDEVGNFEVRTFIKVQ